MKTIIDGIRSYKVFSNTEEVVQTEESIVKTPNPDKLELTIEY